MARLISQAPSVLSRHLWVWPLIGALVIGLVGWWAHRRVDLSTQAELASRLRTILLADISALRLWFSERQSDAKAFTTDQRVQTAIGELVDMADKTNTTPADLAGASAATVLQTYLTPALRAQDYQDYVVLSTQRRILASPFPEMVGLEAPSNFRLFLDRALANELAVSRPFPREIAAGDRPGSPTMFVAAPVHAENGHVIAVLALRMRPDAEFSRVFAGARTGDTGESYAFDRRGMMLTTSRFDGELRRLRLIPNAPDSTAILSLRLLDPEANLSAGEPRPKARRDLELTRMAQSAVFGDSGWDVKGYRSYRGVRVVGAWAWLPEYGMGVATEVATTEAFKTLYILRQAFAVLLGLLAVSGLAIFGFTLTVERLQASLRKSAVVARHLGQYILVQEIGRGGNGMVYRARHALLRRPVAIKLLNPDITDRANAARFEQEVQMTSQLTHPNTVAIYDYGRTPEGLFYYAMEYLTGIDLHQLILNFGPQRPGRVVHILRQACGSLAEAHKIGLIHRDIKPANMVLTQRGGVGDLLKVLDFGLVKTVQKSTRDKAVVGTPHFMSPEAIETPELVDPRSDLYSLGAVAYWLMTGHTLFESDEVGRLLEHQVKDAVPSPSERLGRAVPADLEAIVMQCLQKSPAARPPSAAVLEEALARCASAGEWSRANADRWWDANLAVITSVPSTAMPEKTLVIAPRT